jgi:hypothetical protein
LLTLNPSALHDRICSGGTKIARDINIVALNFEYPFTFNAISTVGR